MMVHKYKVGDVLCLTPRNQGEEIVERRITELLPNGYYLWRYDFQDENDKTVFSSENIYDPYFEVGWKLKTK